ncbi:HutD family protein [Thalassotalea litorea]|uniref:HutD family protein n=1 Tax=Thalassotalea litorea TaxID=2020715 RepID=A0A5R9IZL3_9GAMM|nr:HutD family protein [Thalassotalea litorea]TLU67348.1 HutD family protein [Thalassotalea litorea]
MQYTITTPEQFILSPWKNGKGTTIELAINDGASFSNFAWRLSMADVVEDGEFSDFGGYLRNLVLIDGQGITLTHDAQTSDTLDQVLQFATFDGSSKTVAKLSQGAIRDFNIITDKTRIDTRVETYPNPVSISATIDELCFVYALTDTLAITLTGQGRHKEQVTLLPNHLLKVSSNDATEINIFGQAFILVQLISLDDESRHQGIKANQDE